MATLRIQLDGPTRTYTNLDVITGRVLLTLQTATSFSAINVKLEGESRSRLSGGDEARSNMPGGYDSQQQRQAIELEFHRILYKTQAVFPTPELMQLTTASSYTLSPGQYEYPFKIKFPFNNICGDRTAVAAMGALKLQDAASSTYRHVKRTLPPSLGGFPGMAEIKYFVKVTAVRPKFYQENMRAFQDVRFVPIEPPRQDDSGREESFARRNHKFAESAQSTSRKSITKKGSNAAGPPDATSDPPKVTVDARLPSPPILTCNGTLPLRILVRKTNKSSDILFLSTLTIELFAFTQVRAQDLARVETGSWILTSQANLQSPLGTATDSPDKELKIPKRFWEDVRLPDSICPSFETCNVSRSYELEVRVGISHGVVGNIRPELIVLPLRFKVRVFSGIPPPPRLLEAMSEVASSSYQLSLSVPTSPFPVEPSPIMSPYSTPPVHSAQVGTQEFTENDPPWDDAPPTYEEALTQDITPVNGPRTNYNPPPSPRPQMPPRPSQPRGGNKSGVHRIPSERLFPESTGGTASTSSSARRPSANREQGVVGGSPSISSTRPGDSDLSSTLPNGKART